MTPPPNDPDIYSRLGSLEGKSDTYEGSISKIFDKLDLLIEKVNTIQATSTTIGAVDQKAEKAHERLDTLVQHLDSVKTKALLIIGGSGIGGAGLGHIATAVAKKMGLL
jgi:uncharacterized coiled-coil protein SlyX